MNNTPKNEQHAQNNGGNIQNTHNISHAYHIDKQLSNQPLTAISVDTFDVAYPVIPSGISQMSGILNNKHIIIVYAEVGWGAEAAISHLIRNMLNRISPSPQKQYYMGSLNVDALLHGLQTYPSYDGKTHEQRTGIHNAVVHINKADADKFPLTTVSSLIKVAKEQNTYIILETDKNKQQWELTYGKPLNAIEFINLHESSPYTAKDLTIWLMHLLQDTAYHSSEIGKYLQSVDASTTLPKTETTIEAAATQLQSPGNLWRFAKRLHQIDDVQGIAELLTHTASEPEPLRIWFDNLTHIERYIVLTLALINQLEQKRFWSIYEVLIKSAWRERDQTLVMADYQDTLSRLSDYIHFTNNQNEVIAMSETVQSQIISYALDGYVRSIVNALPVLAHLLTYTEDMTELINTNDDIPNISPLKRREIFGTEYDSVKPSHNKHSTLQQQLVSSITQITLNQVDITESLFLTWFIDYQGAPKQQDNLRRWFSHIFLTMYNQESINQRDDIPWHQTRTTYQILYRWYVNYQETSSSGQVFATTNNQKVGVRQALAYVLSNLAMSDYVRTQDFMQCESDVPSTDTLTIITPYVIELPDAQPAGDQLTSPWHMLIALALDPSWAVRAAVADNLPKLLVKYPSHFLHMLRLLASDSHPSVRFNVAASISQLFMHDQTNFYLVRLLLNETDKATYQSQLINTPQHYTLHQVNAVPTTYTLSHWTAFMAVLWISMQETPSNRQMQNLDYLKICLQAYLRQQGEYFNAFTDSLNYLISLQDNMQSQQLALIVSYMLSDTVYGNRVSYVSQYIQKNIKKWGLDIDPQLHTNTLDSNPEGTFRPLVLS